MIKKFTAYRKNSYDVVEKQMIVYINDTNTMFQLLQLSFANSDLRLRGKIFDIALFGR